MLYVYTKKQTIKEIAMSISEKELEYRQRILLSLRLQKEKQDSCPHTRGLSSSYPPNESPSAFHGLKLWDGEVVAVCPYCQKKISSKDPEDAKYFSAPGNYWISRQYLPEAGDPRNFIEISEEDQEKAISDIKENNGFQLTKDYLWNLSLEEKLLKIDPRNSKTF
jgi:hypothetical protein